MQTLHTSNVGTLQLPVDICSLFAFSLLLHLDLSMLVYPLALLLAHCKIRTRASMHARTTHARTHARTHAHVVNTHRWQKESAHHWARVWLESPKVLTRWVLNWMPKKLRFVSVCVCMSKRVCFSTRSHLKIRTAFCIKSVYESIMAWMVG